MLCGGGVDGCCVEVVWMGAVWRWCGWVLCGGGVVECLKRWRVGWPPGCIVSLS